MVTVAWISPFAPDRSGGGGQIRQAHLLLALAQRAEIELICPGPVRDAEVRAAVTRLVEVDPVVGEWRVRHPWLRRAADIAASVVSRQPIEVRAFRPVRRALRPAIRQAQQADLVLVEFAGLAPLLPRRRSRPAGARGQKQRPAGARGQKQRPAGARGQKQRPAGARGQKQRPAGARGQKQRPAGARGQKQRPAGARGQKPSPWVLTLHNLPSRMALHQAAVAPHRRQRWLLARDAKVGAAFERRAASAFDAVITCTDEDAATLGGAGKVAVVPNGTDVDHFTPTPLQNAPRIVFTGALYTTPNVDAARWFCQSVLPLVRREVPTAEIDLVGAAPVAEVLALGALPGVTVHADVPTVVPFLDAARLAVVPIRVGSGTRLKALEAMAAGRPVVGTTIGLEGLGLRPGEHALVADDAPEFADAVVRLLRDDELAQKLAAAGRLEVERRFAWPAIGAAFADFIMATAGAA